MLRLSEELGRILPAGVYEEGGRLCVCFGPVFRLEAGQEDQAASRQVMERIAALLPEKMRGPFSARN